MMNVLRRIIGGAAVVAILATAAGCENSPTAPQSDSLSPNSAAFSKGGWKGVPPLSGDTTKIGDAGTLSLFGIEWP